MASLSLKMQSLPSDSRWCSMSSVSAVANQLARAYASMQPKLKLASTWALKFLTSRWPVVCVTTSLLSGLTPKTVTIYCKKGSKWCELMLSKLQLRPRKLVLLASWKNRSWISKSDNNWNLSCSSLSRVAKRKRMTLLWINSWGNDSGSRRKKKAR